MKVLVTINRYAVLSPITITQSPGLLSSSAKNNRACLKVLHHPAYCSDLASIDYHLFQAFNNSFSKNLWCPWQCENCPQRQREKVTFTNVEFIFYQKDCKSSLTVITNIHSIRLYTFCVLCNFSLSQKMGRTFAPCIYPCLRPYFQRAVSSFQSITSI